MLNSFIYALYLENNICFFRDKSLYLGYNFLTLTEKL